MEKTAARLSNEFSSSSLSAMSGSSTSTQLDEIQRLNIETEFLDYLHFANPEFDPSKDPPVQDVISYFWKDLSSRFPYLSNLAYNLLVIQVSSASSEREFLIAGWHSLGRKKGRRKIGRISNRKNFLT